MFEILISITKASLPPQPDGSMLFNGPVTGTQSFSFIVPLGVRMISAVAIGKGNPGRRINTYVNEGGGGGGLSYTNNVPVTEGETLTIQFSTTYVALYKSGFAILQANNAVGRLGGKAVNGINHVGFAGGSAAAIPTLAANAIANTGGAGAAGYAGDGGSSPALPAPPTNGVLIYVPGGRGIGGGGGSGVTTRNTDGSGSVSDGHTGGGVGIMGQGSDGAGGVAISTRYGGRAGSGGDIGYQFLNPGYGGTGKYGGGGNGNPTHPPANACGIAGLRIIWGDGREYPKTRVSTP